MHFAVLPMVMVGLLQLLEAVLNFNLSSFNVVVNPVDHGALEKATNRDHFLWENDNLRRWTKNEFV